MAVLIKSLEVYGLATKIGWTPPASSVKSLEVYGLATKIGWTPPASSVKSLEVYGLAVYIGQGGSIDTSVNASTLRQIINANNIAPGTNRQLKALQALKAGTARKTAITLNISGYLTRKLIKNTIITPATRRSLYSAAKVAVAITPGTLRAIKANGAIIPATKRSTTVNASITPAAKRNTTVNASLSLATNRQTGFISASLAADTRRTLISKVPNTWGAYRRAVVSTGLKTDTCRVLNHLVIANDTSTTVVYGETLNADTQISVNGKAVTNADTAVYALQDIEIKGTEVTLPTGRLISFNLQMSADNMSDTITLETINSNWKLSSKLSGKFLDYDLSGFEVSRIQTTGARQQVILIQDWRKFAKHINYIGGAPDTIQELVNDVWKDRKRYNSAQSSYALHHKYAPDSEDAYYSTSVKEELAMLGAGYIGTDYPIIKGDDIRGQSGSISELISNVIGWLNALPHMRIVPRIVKGKVICRQRGYEANEVDLSTLRYPKPTLTEYENTNVYSCIRVINMVTKGHFKRNFQLFKYPENARYSGLGNADGSSTSINQDKYGRPLHTRTTQQNGSYEEVSYSYSDTAGAVQNIIEYHTSHDAETKETKTWTVTTSALNSRGAMRALSYRSNTSINGDNTNGDNTNGDNTLMTDGGSQYSPATISKNTAEVWQWTKQKTGEDKYYYTELIDNQGNHENYITENPVNSSPFPLQINDAWAFMANFKNCKYIKELQIELVTPVVMGVPKDQHIYGFNDRFIYKGVTFYLQSNQVSLSPSGFKQALILVNYSREG